MSTLFDFEKIELQNVFGFYFKNKILIFAVNYTTQHLDLNPNFMEILFFIQFYLEYDPSVECCNSLQKSKFCSWIKIQKHFGVQFASQNQTKLKFF
jgi:hypothetical protein